MCVSLGLFLTCKRHGEIPVVAVQVFPGPLDSGPSWPPTFRLGVGVLGGPAGGGAGSARRLLAAQRHLAAERGLLPGLRAALGARLLLRRW